MTTHTNLHVNNRKNYRINRSRTALTASLFLFVGISSVRYHHQVSLSGILDSSFEFVSYNQPYPHDQELNDPFPVVTSVQPPKEEQEEKLDGISMLKQKYAKWNIPFLIVDKKEIQRQKPPHKKESKAFVSISLNPKDLGRKPGQDGNGFTDDLANLAQQFYQYHSIRMHVLVNESSALVWGTPEGPRDYGAFYSFFTSNSEKEEDSNSSQPSLYRVPPEQKNDPDPSVFDKSQYIVWDNICMVAKSLRQYYHMDSNTTSPPPPPRPPRPHVLILGLNENWGSLSQSIPNKTVGWVTDLEEAWSKKDPECTKQYVLDYLNHQDTRAVVTTQFQFLQHPKLHSLPLGFISYHGGLHKILRVLRQHPPPSSSKAALRSDTRPQLLMINSSPSETRTPVYETIIHNFAKKNITVQNTYGIKTNHYENYRQELRRSKFILSPSGLGLDCYRHWEALTMGTIPVIEHLNRTQTDGWFRVLEGLPVALIDSYDHLTPAWLEEEYRRIVSRPKIYQYEKMTKAWWIQLIKSSLAESQSLSPSL